MKRKLPDQFTDDEQELDFFGKIPQIEGEERETDAIEYRFELTLRHLAAVNVLYMKCLEFMQEDVVKTFYRNCAGETYFADIMQKHLFSIMPYCSATRFKLSCMVSQVVKMIYDWIRHVDRTVFNVRCARQSIAVDFVHHIAVTTRGTINYAKSAESLLSNPKFDDFDRLKIVCVHCLERYVLPVSSRAVVPEDYLRKVFKGTLQMIEFWKRCVASREFMMSRFYTIDEQVYNSVGVTNTEAVKFLWMKTSYEEKTKMLVKLVRRSCADLQCFLLSQVDGDEQQRVFKNCGGVVLNNLYDDFIWGSYVLATAYHARHVIPSPQYYQFMKRITMCMQFDNRQCRNEIIFKQLWGYSTKRIKDLIFRHESSHIFYWFRNDISAEYMMTVFSDASAGFKQAFILSTTCRKVCMEMIKNSNLNVLETVIRKTYSNEEEMYHFKRFLLNDERCKDVICHLVKAADRGKFDAIMKWFFRSDNEMKVYKKNFTSTSNYLNLFKDPLYRAVFENKTEKKIRDEINFAELDEMIDWFITEYKAVGEFKEKMLASSKGFTDVVHELIVIEQYGLVEQLFGWCLRDRSRMGEFKERLYSGDNKAEIVDVVFTLLWKNDEFISLDDFMKWCFGTNETKIREFKQSVLGAFKEAHKLWGSLLYREEFGFAEQLIRWCGKRGEFEILQFKNELMLNVDLEYVTNEVRYTLDIRDGEHFGTGEADRLLKCHRLIRWFNPTVETYEKFKRMLFVDELRYSKYCNLIRMFMEENDVDGFAV